MTFTKTLMMSAAAAAFMVASGGAAWALECPTGSTGLPNTQWSWQAGTTTETDIGDISFAGGSGNAFADVTTTTLATCTAKNPGGELVPAQGYSEEITSESTENVKVCQNVGGPGGPTSEPIVEGANCAMP